MVCVRPLSDVALSALFVLGACGLRTEPATNEQPAPSPPKLAKEASPAPTSPEPATSPPEPELPEGPSKRWPTIAEAGGPSCQPSAPVRIGTNTSRRPQRASPQLSAPGEPAPSNLQIARIGDSLVAVWPAHDNQLTLQPLDDDGKPRGEQRSLEAEDAFTLFALTRHGGGAPLALLQTVHSCKGRARRCIDSWWIDAEGRPLGEMTQEYLSEGMVGDKSNVIDLAHLRGDREGVISARSYDSSNNGYLFLGCNLPNREPVDPCPVTMRPPTLDLYRVGEHGEVQVETLVQPERPARQDLMFPITSEIRRGALRHLVNPDKTRETWLHWVGEKPIRLRKLEFDIGADGIDIDADAGELRLIQVPRGEPPVQYRFGFDGERLSGPDPVDLDRVTASLGGSNNQVTLSRQVRPGQDVGQDLVLASTDLPLKRLDSMHALIWDRDRFVVIYGLPSDKLEWAVTTQIIHCEGG